MVTTNLPKHLYSHCPNESLSAELREACYSWHAGLRPVRTRIESLLAVGDSLRQEMDGHLDPSAHSIDLSMRNITCIAEETDILKVSLSNSRTEISSRMNANINTVLQIVRLRRRRYRIVRTLELIDRSISSRDHIAALSIRNSAESLADVSALLESLPEDMLMVSGLRETLRQRTYACRREIMELVVSVASLGSAGDDIRCQLEHSVGPLELSILACPRAFWSGHVENEAELELYFMNALIFSTFMQNFCSSDSFDRVEGKHTKLSLRIFTMISNLEIVFQMTTVLSRKLLECLKNRLSELYAILVFTTANEHDFACLISSSNDLAHAHEIYLRRKRFAHLMSLIHSDCWNSHLHTIHRYRPRKQLSISSVCQAVKSLENFDCPQLRHEISSSVYDNIVNASLAHAIAAWRENTLAGEYVEANDQFCDDIRGFLSAIKYAGSSSGVDAITHVAEEVVISEIVKTIPDMVSVDEEEIIFFTESIRNLQVDLSRILPLRQNRWSIVYECMQIASLRNGDLLYSWAAQNVHSLPLETLAKFIMLSADEDETKLGQVEQLENLVASLVTEQTR